jgi:hypothetical protein
MQVKHEHEGKLARILGVAPPQPYERGADGKRVWWRRALELFGTFNHERPNHLRLFQDGCEPRSFADRHEDPEHIA